MTSTIRPKSTIATFKLHSEGTEVSQTIHLEGSEHIIKFAELSDSQWSWLYLLLLDTDSPSRTWLVADWLEEDSLELLPVRGQSTPSEESP